MATYAIGDVQGCFDALMALLRRIRFNPEQDTLWFVGDLVNRGSQSLEVLRFVRALPQKTVVILGNHDLHLLAVAHTDRVLSPSDTMESILTAPDGAELLDWLRRQKFLHEDASLDCVAVHAGIYPLWDLTSAKQYAREIEQVLRSDGYVDFLRHMYGNSPAVWHDDLQGVDRYRFIVNAFSRMRYCRQDGSLDLEEKGAPAQVALDLYPWFAVPGRLPIERQLIFGHWASLEGKVDDSRLFAIDTGCVWGGRLTALRLEDQRLFSVAG